MTNKVRLTSYPCQLDTNLMALSIKNNEETDYKFLFYFIERLQAEQGVALATTQADAQAMVAPSGIGSSVEQCQVGEQSRKPEPFEIRFLREPLIIAGFVRSSLVID